jgi:3-oxoacyl-[acyl-carrier-protein] synthase II
MALRRVVITGIGPVSPIGIGVEKFRAGLKDATVGIGPITAFDASHFRSQIGGEIAEFQCKEFIPKFYRKSAKLMARDIELAVAAADCALRDAKLNTKGTTNEAGPIDIDPTRLGCNIGAGLICPELNELTTAFAESLDESGELSLKRWGKEGITHLTPLWLLKYLPNMLACHVTILHDAQAPSNTITSAEASAQLAVGEAFRTVSRGIADVSLCGGAESKMHPMGVLRQDLTGRLTTKNDQPKTAVRPYDADRSGTAIAEGGAIFVAEALESATKRGASIYAEIAGFGASFGTADFIHPENDGEAIATAITKAMADAKVSAKEIDAVIGFGSGVKAHDRAEAQAIRRVLGDVAVTSIVGQIGNSGAGTGALTLATAALAIRDGFVPATVNCAEADSECPVNVVRSGQTREIKTVVSLSYSLSGGQVAAIVLKKYVG